MQKSIVIAREEFKEALVNMINGSGLPFFVIRDVLTEVKPDLDKLVERQLEMEKQAYEKAKAEEAAKAEEEENQEDDS